MDFSVLWAVFPLLDQLVEHKPIDLSGLAWGLVMALTSDAIGVILRRMDST
jgi:hypothetical protein